MDDDFLTRLDAAVEQRCSCPCGAPITGASPSAWFASERCAKIWHAAENPHSQALVGTGPIAEILAHLRGVVVWRDESHHWPASDHNPDHQVSAVDYSAARAHQVAREAAMVRSLWTDIDTGALDTFFSQLVRDINRVFGEAARHIRVWMSSNGFDVDGLDVEPADVLTRVVAARRRRNTGPPAPPAAPPSRCAWHESRAVSPRQLRRGQVPYNRR